MGPRIPSTACIIFMYSNYLCHQGLCPSQTLFRRSNIYNYRIYEKKSFQNTIQIIPELL